MCRSSDHKLGQRRCQVSESQRQAANARKCQKYAEKKGGISHGNSNREGQDGLPEASRLAGGLDTGRERQDRSSLDGHGHRDGNRSEFGVVSKEVGATVISKHEPDAVDAARHIAEGKVSVTLYEIEPETGAGIFRDQIHKLKKGHKFHASVYVYEEEEYKNMRLFMTDDGESGIALKPNGDIVSVFSLDQSKYKRSACSMISTAVKLGGTKLDCFDTVLPKIYAQEGFVEVGRDKWAEEYKPEGWEYDTYKSYNDGRPDVVYMEYRGLGKAGK